jgi:hypothetical protein
VKLSNEDKVEYFCISKNAFILKWNLYFY